MTCKARQFSDQMVCDVCSLAWDVNDQDPPVCEFGNEYSHGYTAARAYFMDLLTALETAAIDGDSALFHEMIYRERTK